MSEINAMTDLKTPNTRISLKKSFQQLGLEKGVVVIVHSSLSAFGWVCGGPVAVIQALMDVVGDEGTIVMPTQTGENSDPAKWENPPVPKEWWPIIRDEMPAYDPDITPTRAMGKIVETFRTFPGVKRSSHPMYSFAAWGKHRDYIVSEQPLEEGFGSRSPLAKIYELEGYILLLGVSHDSNTSFHFAEHAIPNPKTATRGTAYTESEQRVWKTYEEIDYDSDSFEELGEDFENAHQIRQAKIGKATCKLMEQVTAVDFARKWLVEKANQL